MFTITDRHGIYQAATLDEAEGLILANLSIPARLFDAATGKRIPFTCQCTEEGNVLTYPEGIEKLGIAAGSQFLKPLSDAPAVDDMTEMTFHAG